LHPAHQAVLPLSYVLASPASSVKLSNSSDLGGRKQAFFVWCKGTVNNFPYPLPTIALPTWPNGTIIQKLQTPEKASIRA